MSRTLIFSIGIVAVLAIALALGQSLLRGSHQILALSVGISPAVLMGAFFVGLIYRITNATGWTWIARCLGAEMPVSSGLRIWLVSEALRWLPIGSVLGYLGRAGLARREGVTMSLASMSVSVEVALTLAAWGLTAAGGLLLSGWDGTLGLRLDHVIVVLALGAAIAGLTSVIVLRSKSSRAEKARRLLLDMALLVTSPHTVIRLAWILFFYAALCVLHGSGLWLSLQALGIDAPLTLVVGANALAWIVGFFAIGAPGGLGAREAGATGILAMTMGVPEALAGVVLWRLAQLMGEALLSLTILREVFRLASNSKAASHEHIGSQMA